MTDRPLPAIYDALTSSGRRDVRNQYIRLQGGLCCHCGGSLDNEAIGVVAKAKINERLFSKNFFAFPVHLHRCHKTGLTIGAVHNRCNAYLWQLAIRRGMTIVADQLYTKAICGEPEGQISEIIMKGGLQDPG